MDGYAEHIRARFAASNGTDPIFRTVDGANCPSADVSTLSARRGSYSMLLNKGLIRVSIGVPANSEVHYPHLELEEETCSDLNSGYKWSCLRLWP
jgi:hypothetical protein